MNKESRRKLRTMFFSSFIIVFLALAAFCYFYDIYSKFSVFLVGAILFTIGFKLGDKQGKEHMKGVWAFAHPDERNKLDLIEEAMYDKEDHEYFEGKSEGN